MRSHSRFSQVQSQMLMYELLFNHIYIIDNSHTHTQGLSDPEETVVCKTLEAITAFCERKLFSDQRLLEVFTESIPFLCHPVSPTIKSL